MALQVLFGLDYFTCYRCEVVGWPNTHSGCNGFKLLGKHMTSLHISKYWMCLQNLKVTLLVLVINIHEM